MLDRNLNDALDIQRSKTQAVYVNILNKKQADYTPMVASGLAFTVYGVTIYYVLPLALMSFNLSLMSQIVIFILVGLLIALTILAWNIQPHVERLLTMVFLCFEKDSIRKMVNKNLSSHRKRNQMTALIYSLALGFLIFLSMSSRMQISVSAHEELKNKGAQFVVEMQPRANLPVEKLETILKANEHIVEEFSWVTNAIDNHDNSFIVKASIDSLVNYRVEQLLVYATQPNYFNTAETNYLLEYHVFLDEDDWSPLLKDLGHPYGVGTNLGEQLYTARGSQGMGLYGWIDDSFNVYPLFD